MIRSTRTLRQLQWLLAGMLLLSAVFAGRPASAQSYDYAEPRFDRPALDAMLAPVALYPDQLLSQVLMAATYPDEVGEAARWLRDHPGLSGDAAVRSADGWDWDPSVRSLLAFPMVLQTLADYPSWTSDLGEAFLAQREEVMDTIQQLRRRALAEGSLRSTEYTRVVDNGYAVVIETINPQAVYVPYYDPRSAYGTWWWPARPPMHWSPWAGYHVLPGRERYVYWGPGIRLGAGFFFGDFVWSRREVRIVDVRPYYYPRSVVVERNVIPGRPIVERRPPAPDVWRHDAHRRNALPPRDPARGRSEPPRAAPPVRAFDNRGGPNNYGPGNERRGPDRRDPVAAPVAPPATVVPAPSAAPRAPREYRGDSRPPSAGPERRSDEGRHRAPPPAIQAPAAQAPAAAPRSAPPQPAQRSRDGNDERQGSRRQREQRDSRD